VHAHTHPPHHLLRRRRRRRRRRRGPLRTTLSRAHPIALPRDAATGRGRAFPRAHPAAAAASNLAVVYQKARAVSPQRARVAHRCARAVRSTPAALMLPLVRPRGRAAPCRARRTARLLLARLLGADVQSRLAQRLRATAVQADGRAANAQAQSLVSGYLVADELWYGELQHRAARATFLALRRGAIVP